MYMTGLKRKCLRDWSEKRLFCYIFSFMFHIVIFSRLLLLPKIHLLSMSGYFTKNDSQNISSVLESAKIAMSDSLF